MATFTTYTAAAAALRNSIASGALGVSEITINGQTKRWHDPATLRDTVQWLEQQAALESGAVSLRVYARNGGRG